MEASVTKLVDLLGDARQYLIPLFQRPYSWERNEWKTLWDDLVELCADEHSRPHFFGSIVVIPARSVPEGVTKYNLIDGQQRYTTVSIIFAALRYLAQKEGESRLSDELFERFLINKFAEGNDYFKLLPTQSDRKTYQQIILGKEIENEDARLAKAFYFFENQIRRSQIPLRRLKEALERSLSVVRILLDEREDPYLVFESLNAKGMPLSQADLIRNYFLMRLHSNKQEEIYAAHWRPMEETLGEKNLTEFIRHYLVMRKGDFVKASNVYLALKDYASEKDALEELQTLHAFSEHYARLLELHQDANQSIANAIRRLNRLEITTAYPFLLACYDDYANTRLADEAFLEVLKTIENFIIRRFVCNVPTNQLNKIFAPLYRQVKNLDLPFVDGVKSVLETRNYPKDYEFKRSLVETKLYGGGDRREKTKFILETLEQSFGHNESVATDALQIEHVMPQTLTEWWKSHLGENWELVYETNLNTLGNLTLTGYNSQLSNEDFNKKKRIYAESHLELNAYFNEVETWREDDMRLRGEELAKKCLEIWKYFGKQNIQEQPASESEQAYSFESLHNSDYLTGNVLELFEDLQDKIMRLGAVEEKIMKQYIGYRARGRSFLSVVPLASGLKLYLNLPYEEITPPSGIACKDVSQKGHWGVGDVEVKVQETSDIGRVMPLVEKAYRKQLE